jgi:C-terminal peptidase prc
MKTKAPIALICVAALCALVDSPPANADEPLSTQSPTSLTISPDFCKLVNEITDTVLENHIDPPARQQLVLGGLKAVYEAAGVPVPIGLSRRVSAQATPQQFAGLLADAWPKSSSHGVSNKELEGKFLDGLLLSVPGEAELISAKDRRVAEQIAGNRYVGIHIALGTDDKEKRPRIVQVTKGGPANKGGVKTDDVLEQIDGVDTKGMLLRDAVDRLRGDEGTDVTILVRQPQEQKSRTITITRGQLPQVTVRGIRPASPGQWQTRLVGSDAVGYLRISEISASTPHELRKLARLMESEGIKRVVIDLRGLFGNSTHPAVLLADCLLDRGMIGRVRTANGERTYQAEPDAVFLGWPMAALIDGNTLGTGEWLAAALQDNHRATLVGRPTGSASKGSRGFEPAPPVLRATVSVGDGPWSLNLVTGLLERGSGQPLGVLTFGSPGSFPTGRLLRREPPEATPAPSPKTGVNPDRLMDGRPDRVSPQHRLGEDYDASADATVQEAARILRAGAHDGSKTAGRNEKLRK